MAMKATVAVAAVFGLLAAVAPVPARAQPSPLTWRLDIPLPERGCEFPDLSLPDTKGVMVSFREFQGKPILLAFCSCYLDTGCHLLGKLQEVRSQYRDRLAIVLVCSEVAEVLLRDGYGQLEQRAAGVIDRILLDPEGRARAPFLVSTLPTTYLIDTAFCMRYKAVAINDLNTPEFAAELARILAPPPAP